MKVSIIIPVAERNSYLDENIRHCLSLDFPDYEILVLPDNDFSFPDNRVKIIPTGNEGPAVKRNIGIKHAKGELAAFIDDDTFPDKDWLKNAVGNFSNPEIAAVGGPAVTPHGDSIRKQGSGAVYSSFLGGGAYRYRYIPLKKRFVDDYPSCNFIVRKSIMDELGGFQTNFWPGEDTALCLDITNKLNKKIIYDPKAVIYHHRRMLFGPHLRQIKAYALHRGYFAKRYPRTSLRLSYFLPSIFLAFLLSGWLVSEKLYLMVIAFYIFLAIISVLGLKTWRLKIITFLGIVATHITYSLWFIKGLLSGRLEEE